MAQDVAKKNETNSVFLQGLEQSDEHIVDTLIKERCPSFAAHWSWPLTRRMLAAYAVQNDRSAAYALLNEHLRAEPRNREAAAMLALLAFDAGRREQGVALLDHALVSGGRRDPRLWALKAEAGLLQGDVNGAREAAEHAYRLQRSDPLARRVLARAFAASGNVAAAQALAGR